MRSRSGSTSSATSATSRVRSVGFDRPELREPLGEDADLPVGEPGQLLAHRASAGERSRLVDEPGRLQLTQGHQRGQVAVGEQPLVVPDVGEAHCPPQPAAVVEGHATALGQVEPGVLARATEEDSSSARLASASGPVMGPSVPRTVPRTLDSPAGAQGVQPAAEAAASGRSTRPAGGGRNGCRVRPGRVLGPDAPHCLEDARSASRLSTLTARSGDENLQL